LDIQKHCFVVQTKKAGGKCMLQVKHRQDSAKATADDQDWKDAGAICFQFTLYEDNDGTCVVQVEPLDPE
jgi:hypothetical protein